MNFINAVSRSRHDDVYNEGQGKAKSTRHKMKATRIDANDNEKDEEEMDGVGSCGRVHIWARIGASLPEIGGSSLQTSASARPSMMLVVSIFIIIILIFGP